MVNTTSVLPPTVTGPKSQFPPDAMLTTPNFRLISGAGAAVAVPFSVRT